MDRFESHVERNFVRNPLKRKHLLGDFITTKSFGIKQKDTNNQKEKNDRIVNSDKCDPLNLTVKDADAAIIQFMRKVKKFQDSAWEKNPIKAKSKHRFVCGLREVQKQLSLGAVRCIILARDIKTNKNTELAAEIDEIKKICASNRIDILWISSKHKLGKAVNKWPVVSAVAILDYRGAEDAHSTAMQTLANLMASCQIIDHADQPSLLVDDK